MRTRLPWWLLAVLACGCTSSDVCFSPDESCSAVLIEEIDAAGSSIHAAVYTFTDADLKDHLVLAAQRGVDVQVVLDPWEANDAIYSALSGEEVAVRRSENPGGGIMHHKFAVIDDRVVLTGSYNWTEAADHTNDENLVRFTDPQLAGQFDIVFDELWERGE